MTTSFFYNFSLSFFRGRPDYITVIVQIPVLEPNLDNNSTYFFYFELLYGCADFILYKFFLQFSEVLIAWAFEFTLVCTIDLF